MYCRCEVPEGTEEQARLQLLVSWIIDHPDAIMEDEVRDLHVHKDG